MTDPKKPEKRPVPSRTAEDEMDRLREQEKDDDQTYEDWKHDQREMDHYT